MKLQNVTVYERTDSSLMEDTKILDLYRERSEDAIRETKEKYSNYCFSIIYGIVSNYEDAEECLNDTFLKAWNSIPPNRPDSLKMYLGKIARNTAIDRLRQKSGQKRDAEIVSLSEVENLVSTSGDVESTIHRKEVLRIVNAFLETRKPLHRVVFVQKYWYLLSVKQIAEQNGISSSKVLSILHRMRGKLKEKLEKEGYKI